MLDRYERDKLWVIESQIAAADPEFAAVLRGDQRHLPRTVTRTGLRTMLGLLVILAGGLLVLGLPVYSLAMAAFAAVLWWLRGCTLTSSKADGGERNCPSEAPASVGSSVAEEDEHREHAAVIVADLRYLQLGEDAADVLLHRALGHR